jgi:hypothetical protein
VTLASPLDLRVTLIRLFPEFASKSEETEAGTYHQVIMDLAPHLKHYLEGRYEREVRAFSKLVNDMVEAGGEQRNAIETCLLEHASQVGCAKILKPFLSSAAREELR